MEFRFRWPSGIQVPKALIDPSAHRYFGAPSSFQMHDLLLDSAVEMVNLVTTGQTPFMMALVG